MVTMRWHLACCNHFFFCNPLQILCKKGENGCFCFILALYSDSKTSVRVIPVSLEATHNVILTIPHSKNKRCFRWAKANNLFQDLTEDWISNGSRWDAEINSAWRNEREKTERSYTSSAWRKDTTRLNVKRPTITTKQKCQNLRKLSFCYVA